MSARFEPRVHGGVDAQEVRALGLEPAEIVDFSVNLNPYGPCAALVAAANRARLDVYPDPTGWAARKAWARALDTAPERLAVGHGAADLFWAIVRAFVAPGDEVAILEPTFSELRMAAQTAGARVRRLAATREEGWRLPLHALSRHTGLKLAYLCSPNNPTGEWIPSERVANLAAALSDTLIVLDQSFLSLSDHAEDLTRPMPRNVLCVRSLTKDFALPGLRIGLLWADREMVARVEAARPTWATSAPALAAMEAAAGESGFVTESWRRMRADRERVGQALAALGCVSLPSSTGYQLVEVGDGARLKDALLRHGVLVRDASSFGLPGHVRIAARPERELLKLVSAWRSVVPQGGFPACPTTGA